MQWAADWALRCIHESQMHATSSFITLTYDARALPRDGSLDVRHWQLFAKRVRKTLGPIRFFHCGEYGDRNGRPHYHASIFGQDFRPWVAEIKPGAWLSPSLEALWGHGNVSVGELTYESASYVARYVMKKLTGQREGEYEGLKPPYVTMSRRPGIGSTWLDHYHHDVYPSDEVVHNGRKHRVPRYYDARLNEEALRELKAQRLTRLSKRKEDLTPQRLRTRERVRLRNMQARTRTL